MTSTNGDDRREEEIPATSQSHDPDASTLQSTANDESRSALADKPRMTESWRQVAGKQMQSVSDTINDNLVAARYASFASIALLSAYGLANTPLFFRFKTVSDIPSTLRNVTIHVQVQSECHLGQLDSSFSLFLFNWIHQLPSFFAVEPFTVG